MFRRFLLALVIIVGLALAAFAQDKKTSSKDFIRYEEGAGLQIAVTDYVAPTTSQTVTLYGVVHIADAEYYKIVQTDLDKFDVVLYEGVKPRVKVNKETKILNVIQHLTGDLLGLDFQLESIDYTRKNLVHADIDMEDLEERMKDQEVTPFGQFLKGDNLDFLKPILKVAGPLLKEFMKSQPQIQNQLKDNLGKQLSEADISNQLSPQLYESIVVERNKIVLRIMKEQFAKTPEKKTYSIFYGAAHMPDFEERLEKLGFKKTNKRWMTAWKVEILPAEHDDEEIPAPAPARPKQKRLDDRQRNIPDEDK